MEVQLNNLLAGIVLQQLGFQDASETNIPSILSNIYPQGGTALRDSLINGSSLILKLFDMLQKTGTASNWNFVHVILTDGEDQHSNTSLKGTLQVISIIGNKIPVKCLKIILIGVGVSSKAQNQLKAIAKVGGQNAEYFSVKDADIDKIFQRITVNLGLQKRQELFGLASNQGAALFVQEKVSPVLSLCLQNFAVLFNLDVSSSMQGQKWRSVCQSVDRFVDFLGEKDLVAAMVFNNQSKLLSKLSSDDSLFTDPNPKQAPKILLQTSSGKVAVNPEECQIY